MADRDLDLVLNELADFGAPVLRQVYDINAARHDPLFGDDAVTFAVSIYRNSWFQLEQAAAAVDGWTSARPDGSLTLRRGRYRLHVYRHANDETVDVNDFRLDSAAASMTKLGIAQANRDQLTLDLQFSQPTADEVDSPDLDELVIIHSGNPDDGCCGIWVGAPLAADAAPASAWAWIKQLWLIDRPAAEVSDSAATEQARHDELPEPDLDISLADDESDVEDA